MTYNQFNPSAFNDQIVNYPRTRQGVTPYSNNIYFEEPSNKYADSRVVNQYQLSNPQTPYENPFAQKNIYYTTAYPEQENQLKSANYGNYNIPT
jgi:hypothetical protein